MASIRIPRLELSVKGIDEATVALALEALPAALAAELASAPPSAERTGGPLRFTTAPSAETLAGAVAERVAGDVRARRSEA